MTRTRITKRKLEMLDPESDTPSGPAETLTAELSFKSAQESTLPPVSSMDDDDLTEVSSPARPTAVSKIKKQVEWLHEEAETFAKARNVFRHLHSSSSPKAGPSQRELRAQLRAQRAEQSKIGRPVSGINGVPEAADVTELEAAASLVDLMAHEALPESGHDNESLEASQDTGSSVDRAFTAAWAKVYGTHGHNPASASRLATTWQTQHSSGQEAQAEIHAAAIALVAASGQQGQHDQAAEPDLAAIGEPIQPGHTSQQSPLCGGDTDTAFAADELVANFAAEPDAEDEMHKVAEHHELQAVELLNMQHTTTSASPEVDAQQFARPASVSPQRPAHEFSRHHMKSVSRSPVPAADTTTKQQAGVSVARSLSASKAAFRASSLSPVTAGLAGLAASAANRQQAKQVPHLDTSDLEAQALRLAMQRLAEREAQQQQADEALLHNCHPDSLLRVPLWAHGLAPDMPHQLQGTLIVPSACSVRLLRRVFARAVQIQPLCIQLCQPDRGPLLQDFIAGQEASIQQYGVEGNAGSTGLEIHLNLQEGSVRVQALIQQEVDLVKQELLAARLRPAAAHTAGLSSLGRRTPAGPSVTAVLQSAGWGSTSPAKRIPKALPAGAVGQQLAEYEALLPAEPDDCVGAPVVSPERRRLGRWSQAEVETLIRQMETAQNWAHIRDVWPTLGFPKRSAVDLKDKWRNLEDVVIQGKVTRTVKLSQEQKERIHRCHRKYRAMQPAVAPVRSRSPAPQQGIPARLSSPPTKQDSSSDLYRPTTEQTSQSGSDSPLQKQSEGSKAAEVSPMTTRSKARADAAAQQRRVLSPASMHGQRQLTHILADHGTSLSED